MGEMQPMPHGLIEAAEQAWLAAEAEEVAAWAEWEAAIGAWNAAEQRAEAALAKLDMVRKG